MRLTEEEINMTALDFVRHILDKPLTDEEADYILWEKTSFPMDSADNIKKQLLELKESENGI